jgi:hypothetical protein
VPWNCPEKHVLQIVILLVALGPGPIQQPAGRWPLDAVDRQGPRQWAVDLLEPPKETGPMRCQLPPGPGRRPRIKTAHVAPGQKGQRTQGPGASSASPESRSPCPVPPRGPRGGGGAAAAASAASGPGQQGQRAPAPGAGRGRGRDLGARRSALGHWTNANAVLLLLLLLLLLLRTTTRNTRHALVTSNKQQVTSGFDRNYNGIWVWCLVLFGGVFSSFVFVWCWSLLAPSA